MVEQNATLEPHPQLYFPDGDVALVVKQPPPHEDGRTRYQVFRVHKALLRIHSPVFANMFSDATPAQIHDDAPLVEMVGDEASAFASLLMWIYFPSEVNVERWNPDTPINIAPTVRLATKYLIDPLRNHLVKKVVADWPCTLQEWDRQEAEISAITNAPATSGKDRRKLSRSVPEPVAAIVFAIEFGCTEILPAAFYTLSRINITRDWDRTKPPGTSSSRLARWSMLDSPNFIRYLRGCNALEYYCRAKREWPLSTIHEIMNSCARTGVDSEDEDEASEEDDPLDTPCRDYLIHLFAAIWKSKHEGSLLRDPLRSLKDFSEPERFPSALKECPDGLCWNCQDELSRWVVAERKRVWDALVRNFELGGLCQPAGH